MVRRLIRGGMVGMVLWAGLVCSGAAEQSLALQTFSLTWKGTPIHVTIWAKEDAASAATAALCREELNRLEQQYASYRQGSVVNRINQFAAQHPVKIDDETLALLQWAGRLHDETQGAFDITDAVYLWQYGFGQGDYRVPDDLRLAQIKPLVNYRYVKILPAEREVLFRKDGMQIELDSLMVNHTFDRLVHLMAAKGKQQSLRAGFGKSTLVYGKPPQGESWIVSLPGLGNNETVPEQWTKGQGCLLVADLDGQSFEKDGGLYHRYLDVANGHPVQTHQRVYLWREKKFKHDLPAAALMLLPAEKAIALVDAHPGLECLILGNDGVQHQSHGWLKASAHAEKSQTR